MPQWSHDGRELYFVIQDKLFAASISSGTELRAGAPVALFEFRPLRTLNPAYAPLPDGRFVLAPVTVKPPVSARVLLLDPR